MTKLLLLVGLLLALGCQNDPAADVPIIRVRIQNLSTADLSAVTLHLRKTVNFGSVAAGATTAYVRTSGAFDIVGVSVTVNGQQYTSSHQIDWIGHTHPYSFGDHTAAVVYNPERGTVVMSLRQD